MLEMQKAIQSSVLYSELIVKIPLKAYLEATEVFDFFLKRTMR